MSESIPLRESEKRVLRQLARGLSNAEIAQALGLAEHTLRNYLFEVRERLHLETPRQLLVYAVRHYSDDSPVRTILEQIEGLASFVRGLA